MKMRSRALSVWPTILVVLAIIWPRAASFLVAPALRRALTRPPRLEGKASPPVLLPPPTRRRKSSSSSFSSPTSAPSSAARLITSAPPSTPPPHTSETLRQVSPSGSREFASGKEAVVRQPGRLSDEAYSRSLPLWELFREMERRNVPFQMLEDRSVLESRLAEALRLETGNQGRPHYGSTEGGVPSAPRLTGKARPVVAEPPPLRPAPQEEGPLPLPLTSPKLLTVLEAEGGQDGEPSLTGSRDASDVSGVFDGVEQALAWARQLTLEELRIELDFLGEPLTGSKAQMARRLAVAITDTREEAKRAREAAAAVAAEESSLASRDASWDRPLRRPRTDRIAGRRRRRPLPSREVGEESVVSQPRRVSRRSRPPPRALSFTEGADDDWWVEGDEDWAWLEQTVSTQQVDKAQSRRRTAAAGAAPRPMKKSPMGRDGRVQAVETEEVVAGVMMDTVMDASKMAVRWARKAKTAAKALVQVTLEEGLAKTERRRARDQLVDVVRRKRGYKSGVLGVVLSASMNAVIQGLVAAAAWAGAGLVPAKFVLFAAGGVSLLLQRGLGSFAVCLLVARASCTAMRTISMQDEEEEMMSVGPQVERLEDQVAPKRSKTTRRSGPPSEKTEAWAV